MDGKGGATGIVLSNSRVRPGGPLLSLGVGHFRSCLAVIMRALFLLEAFLLNEDELHQVCGVVYRLILSCDFDKNPISSLARDTVPRTT